MHETEVTVNSCMFTYNKHFQCGPDFGNPQTVQFPNPEELPDKKQVRHTLTLLEKAGLLLYGKNRKICAKRLDKCKIYWAFSKQLDNIALHSQFKCLLRDIETEIFDYMQFLQGDSLETWYFLHAQSFEMSFTWDFFKWDFVIACKTKQNIWNVG